MSFGSSAKQILATVAPLLGAAVGGPFGALAGKALAGALGTTDPKAQEGAIISGDPDILLKLKQADADFKIQTLALEISEEKLRFDDTASARARESVVKDHTPQILAYLITAGFFGVVGFLLVEGKPPSGDVMMVMLGALGSSWTGVVTYYFGSSAGSAAKTLTINKIAEAQ